MRKISDCEDTTDDVTEWMKHDEKELTDNEITSFSNTSRMR